MPEPAPRHAQALALRELLRQDVPDPGLSRPQQRHWLKALVAALELASKTGYQAGFQDQRAAQRTAPTDLERIVITTDKRRKRAEQRTRALRETLDTIAKAPGCHPLNCAAVKLARGAVWSDVEAVRHAQREARDAREAPTP